MSKLQHHLQQESEKFRMTDAEKSAMRARISAAMEAPKKAAVASPYMYGWLLAPRSLAVFALAFLVIISSGTAYAAEDSLPGGVLYPVKTGVLEPLAVALATTPAAKAEVNAGIATKRVAEAQTLAAQGALTVETAQQISDNYNAHATAALALAADVDAEATSTSPVVPPAADETTQNEDTVAADDTNKIEDDTSVPTVATTLSIVTTMAPASMPPAASSTATSTTRNAVGRYSKKIKTSVVPVASTTPATSKGLSGKLKATFSVQAKILEQLQVSVQATSTSEGSQRSR